MTNHAARPMTATEAETLQRRLTIALGATQAEVALRTIAEAGAGVFAVDPAVTDDLRITGENADADNAVRAALAATAVAAHSARVRNTDEPVDTQIADLLSDLMHLCDAHGVDFTGILDRATYNHWAEATGR